jgi:endogenous inhibitor of DNA gyrase (YacG/DUF329 family)
MPTYRCVICQRETSYDGPLPELFPFCSHRCRWVDLGRWLREAYTIDREARPEDYTPGETCRAESDDEHAR